MPKSPMLTGVDRIEFSPLLGRAIRSGALSTLKVADQERLREWILAGRTDEAVALLEVMRPLYMDMNRILLEWCLSWGQTVREVLGEETEIKMTKGIHSAWSDIVLAENESPEHVQAAEIITATLSPEKRLGRADVQTIAEKLNKTPLATWHEIVALAKENKTRKALAKFKTFTLQTRAIHDYLCHYLWVCASENQKSHGQEFSERMNMESFQSCSTYEGFFNVVVKLSPEGLVALMAEHLRGHYSGPGRIGKVEIEDNVDNYRIIFDACGSGGAMRRKNHGKTTRGLENYQKPSNSTWNKKGVSGFCAHCAQNEMFMIQRFGFPAWVVNYDPDAMKPCSWTIFKDFEKVPEEYYERVGFKKDPTKIVRLPKD